MVRSIGAKSLSIPKNIGLIFLPPYSPELNPAEKIWLTIKRKFENRLFESLEKLGEFISSSLKKIITEKSEINMFFQVYFCRIILDCLTYIIGVNSVINTKYLDIAYATNGSIHTMEEDLTEMGKMNEGKKFKIAGINFRLVNGKFIQIK